MLCPHLLGARDGAGERGGSPQTWVALNTSVAVRLVGRVTGSGSPGLFSVVVQVIIY